MHHPSHQHLPNHLKHLVLSCTKDCGEKKKASFMHFCQENFFATHLQLPESFFLTVGARPTIDFMHLHTGIDRAEARKLKAAADPLLENPLILGTDCLRPRRNDKHSGSKLLR
jgi:hypothetical protein